MRRVFLLSSYLILLGLLFPVASRAGQVPPRDANLLVLQEVYARELTVIGWLVGHDPGNRVPYTGTVTDSGWTLNVINARYRNGTLTMNITGVFYPAADMIVWDGAVAFTNPIDSLRWPSHGTYANATRDGWWSSFRSLVRTVAKYGDLVNLVTAGAQLVATAATGGAAAAPAVMASHVVDTVVKAGQTINQVIETVETVKKVVSKISSSTAGPSGPMASLISETMETVADRQAAPLPDTEPGLLDGGDMRGTTVYANGEAIGSVVSGWATVSPRVKPCFTVTVPAEADTYVRADLPVRQNDNYGAQEFIEVGSGRNGSADAMRGLVRFDLSALSMFPLTKAMLETTVRSYDNGSPASVYHVDLHSSLAPWVEGNGFEGTAGPPGSTDPDSAVGVNWDTQPAIDPRVIASAIVGQRSDPAGTTVQWDVTRLAHSWLTSANNGLVFKDNTSDGLFRGVRFDSRSNFNLTIPFPSLGATRGPRLVLTQLRPGVDLNGDGFIDQTDLTMLLNARGVASPGDPRDIDGDGQITVLDARQLSMCCTRPGCATTARQ